MPVDWRQVPIPFTAGVDTKSDRKTIRPPKLARLENGVFTERASIVKRFGYDVLSNQTTETDSVTLTAAKGLDVRDNELVLFDASKLYGYQEGTGGWVPRDDFDAMTIIPAVVSDTTSDQLYGTCGTAGGITVVAWLDDSERQANATGVRFSVFDETTGTYYTHEQWIQTGSVAPRVVVINGFIHILHLVNNDGWQGLYTLILNPASIIESLGNSPIQVHPDAESFYDCEPYGDGTAAALVIRDDVGNARAGFLLQDGTIGAPASGYPGMVDTGESCIYAVCIATEPTDEVFFVGCANATGIRGITLDADLGGSLAEIGTRTTIEAFGGLAASQMTAAYAQNDTPTNLWIFWEKQPSGGGPPSNFRVHVARGTSSGTSYTAPTVYHHSGLLSRAFRRLNHVYVQTVFDADLLKTAFLFREDGRYVGKLNPGLSEGLRATAMLTNVDVIVADEEYAFCSNYRARLEADDDSTAIFASHSLKSVSVKFADEATSYASALARRSLFINSGYLYQYDGENPVEAGFHAFPDPDAVVITSQAGSGSLTPGDTYTYLWVYEWDDLNGGRQQSGGIRVTATVGGGHDEFSIDVPTLAQTLKQEAFGRAPVKLVGYRSEANPGPGAPLYRVTDPSPGSATGHPVNDVTADVFTFVDGRADSTITNNEPFYGNSGEQLNIAPESGSIILQAKDRLFVSGVENRNSVYFSKFFTERSSPGEFSPAFVFDVDDEGGPITALGLVNEVLVIFKATRIYAVTGDGPDAIGRGQQFSLPQLVTSDAGCSDQRSVVETPVGLMFRSSKGIYLLDQGLRLRYIGADVEAYNDQTITGAELLTDRNEVRFLTDAGKTLVFNYYFREWSTFTNHEGIASVLWRGVYTFARANGEVLVENQNKYTDNTTPYRLLIETAWLTLGGLQGFMRARRALFLMDWKSTHVIRLSAGYDFETNLRDIYEFDPAATVNSGTWGSQPTWGDDTVWGGAGSSVFQWQVKLARQKCQAIKFRIEDVPPEVAGESFEITEMLMEIGTRKGPYKLRDLVTATPVIGGGGGGPGGGSAGSAYADPTGATS